MWDFKEKDHVSKWPRPQAGILLAEAYPESVLPPRRAGGFHPLPVLIPRPFFFPWPVLCSQTSPRRKWLKCLLEFEKGFVTWPASHSTDPFPLLPQSLPANSSYFREMKLISNQVNCCVPVPPHLPKFQPKPAFPLPGSWKIQFSRFLQCSCNCSPTPALLPPPLNVAEVDL